MTNLTAGPATVQFFWYNDMDLGGSAGGDAAGTGGVNSRYVHAVSSVTPQVQAACSGTASNHAHFQIAAFDTIRAQLADAGIDNLTDTGTTFGPGDYTGAHQWTLSLGAAASATATANLFMQMEVAVNRCPADTNRSGGVDVDDLINVILGWGACP